MGCSPSVRYDPQNLKSNVREHFTDSEKAIIKKTWRYLSNDMTGYGSKVFLRIFQLHPHVKKLFPCRDVEGDDLLRDANFKGHASRFMQAVGAAVDNIDQLDEALAPLLLGLGRQHIHFTGFKGEYFEAFTEAMMFTWQQELGSSFNEDARVTWRKLFNFIMDCLKDGHTMAKKETECTTITLLDV